LVAAKKLPRLHSRILSFQELAARLLLQKCGIGPQRDWASESDVDAENTRGVVVETILILDDNPAILECLGYVLRSEDYSVLEASTGLQAIDTGRQRGPLFLFVTDVELPDASGIDIAVKLVALYPDLPVLVISGNTIDR
jgi:PleD family two-component response regulator